jgi:hypothetical protein
MSAPADPPAEAPAEPEPDPEAVDLVRRRLLLGGAYAAPAVVVSLLVQDPAWAQGACQPSSCPPIVNNCGPFRQACAPTRGG